MIDQLTGTLSDPIAIWLACAFCGIGVPIPEEILGMWAGLQAPSLGGVVGAWLLAGSGFLVRDIVCWTLGRTFGDRLLSWVVDRGLLTRDRVDQARTLIRDKGGSAILVGRMMVGMRAITWVVAGASGIPLRTFVAWDTIGLAITTGAFVATGHLAGPWLLDGMSTVYANPAVGIAVGAIVVGVWWKSRQLRSSDETTDA